MNLAKWGQTAAELTARPIGAIVGAGMALTATFGMPSPSWAYTKNTIPAVQTTYNGPFTDSVSGVPIPRDIYGI